jgi:hypothetical protein
MASIRRRKSTWQAQVRRQGYPPLSRTFHLRADAELWARQTEAELDRGGLPADSRGLQSHTLGDLLERYGNEVVPRKRGSDREVYMLRVILRHAITRLSLHRLTAADIAKYRDHRLLVVKADTVRRGPRRSIYATPALRHTQTPQRNAGMQTSLVSDIIGRTVMYGGRPDGKICQHS